MRSLRTSGYLSLTAILLAVAAASAQPQAPLFDSVDENLNPVSMADMIDGRPLVLAVGSCT